LALEPKRDPPIGKIERGKEVTPRIRRRTVRTAVTWTERRPATMIR